MEDHLGGERGGAAHLGFGFFRRDFAALVLALPLLHLVVDVLHGEELVAANRTAALFMVLTRAAKPILFPSKRPGYYTRATAHK